MQMTRITALDHRIRSGLGRAGLIEALIQIHERNNPTEVLDILEAYLPEKQRNRRSDDPKPGANKGRRISDKPGSRPPMNRRASDKA